MTTPPGPEGSWPLDPQVPPYEQPGEAPSVPAPGNPMPTQQSGPPPQPDAYPPEPPSFVPAGDPQPVQVTTGQGEPVPPQPYAGQLYVGDTLPVVQRVGSAPGEVTPGNDRVPAKYGYMAIGALVLVAAIVIGVAIWAMRTTPKSSVAADWTAEPTASSTGAASATASAQVSTTPSAASTLSASSGASGSSTSTASSTAKGSASSGVKTLPACIPGQRIVTPAWMATAPSGWTCLSGTTNQTATQLGLVSSDKSIIVLTVSSSKDAASACGTDLAKQANSVTPMPDTVWGGKAAKTATFVTLGFQSQARCVQVKGVVYSLVGNPTQGTHPPVVTAMDALTASWVWG